MNIVAFGASSSKSSINQKLAVYTANQVPGATVRVIDLNNYEMPIYSIDREKRNGIPQAAHDFKALIAAADGIVISFAEHNGSYTAAFKNILDWVSRLEGKIWLDKPMLLLATSPGGRGAQTVLNLAATSFPFMGGQVAAKFSLPSFQQNFSQEMGISDSNIRAQFKAVLASFELKLAEHIPEV